MITAEGTIGAAVEIDLDLHLIKTMLTTAPAATTTVGIGTREEIASLTTRETTRMIGTVAVAEQPATPSSVKAAAITSQAALGILPHRGQVVVAVVLAVVAVTTLVVLAKVGT